jgi:fused signal recognition particle receptor
MSFFSRIKSGLEKTRKAVTGQLEQIFGNFGKADEAFFEELEETLILGDMGVRTSAAVVERLRERAKEQDLRDPAAIKAALEDILTDILTPGGAADMPGEKRASSTPTVILLVGVNGAGKTTTAGKLAMTFSGEGRKVLLCAADTFRAAAIDQLEIWAKSSGSDIVRQKEGADPAAVVFDACQAAKARGCDYMICDTAGRLHNKRNLMNELSKIGRVIDREMPGSVRETFLVVDATTGQNGLVQAKEFREAADVTGIVLTKLDGTAKGGIVIAIAGELGIPVRYIGVGEQADDLMPFDARDFVRALLE